MLFRSPYCVHSGESEAQALHLIGGHFTGSLTRHVFESLAHHAEICLHIRVIDGRLTSQRTGGRVFPLVPVAEDTFLFEEGHSRIVFERDAAGAVRAMRFFPEDEGGGEVVPRSDEALPAGRREVSLPREALERVTGEYAFEGAVLRVFLDGGILKVQLAGQPALEIHAQSPSEFFLEVVDATLEFTPAGGRPTGVILRQAGREMPFRRVH